MIFEAQPLGLCKFHTLPVIIPRRILLAEFNAPGLLQGTFSNSDMGLKFDRIGTRIGDGIYVCMRHSEAAVMSLGDLGNNQTGPIFSDIVISDLKMQ
jgi:hypothetical protein